MKQKDREMMEKIVDSESMIYAYFYPSDGSACQQFLISGTPENIANFLGSHFYDASKMVITDVADRLILDTFGGFINSCPDKNLLNDIKEFLIPIQMGEEPGEVLAVSREIAEQYFFEEDKKATMAEMMMP